MYSACLYLPTHSSLNSSEYFTKNTPPPVVQDLGYSSSLLVGLKSFSFILRQGVEEDDIGDDDN